MIGKDSRRRVVVWQSLEEVPSGVAAGVGLEQLTTSRYSTEGVVEQSKGKIQGCFKITRGGVCKPRQDGVCLQ